MEFLRFGSSIPGAYWGCCACDIIQNFKVDPDTPASIEIVSGDGGGSTGSFAGKTYGEIFLQRLRYGTFGKQDMPNHAFIAILTQWQVTSDLGKKWLKILKEQGFEYIRTVNNSVYSGASLAAKPAATVNNNDNHIFMLVRNVGSNSLKDNFTPPKEWSSLPSVKPEAWQYLSVSGEELTKGQFMGDTECFKKLPAAKFYSAAELEAANVPVMMSGIRPGSGSAVEATPQFGFVGAKPELKANRELRIKQQAAMVAAWTKEGKTLGGTTTSLRAKSPESSAEPIDILSIAV